MADDPAGHSPISNIAPVFVAVHEYLSNGEYSYHAKEQHPCPVPDSIQPRVTPPQSKRYEKQDPENNAGNPASPSSFHRNRLTGIAPSVHDLPLDKPHSSSAATIPRRLFGAAGDDSCGNIAWVLKKSSFLPNGQNFGDRECLEN